MAVEDMNFGALDETLFELLDPDGTKMISLQEIRQVCKRLLHGWRTTVTRLLHGWHVTIAWLNVHHHQARGRSAASFPGPGAAVVRHMFDALADDAMATVLDKIKRKEMGMAADLNPSTSMADQLGPSDGQSVETLRAGIIRVLKQARPQRRRLCPRLRPCPSLRLRLCPRLLLRLWRRLCLDACLGERGIARASRALPVAGEQATARPLPYLR